jgi:autotransporter passenger strand-loop-strand repeat protein
MNIVFNKGANYSSAPSWLTGPGGVLDQVASYYDHLFTDNITINITLNWKPLQWSQTSTTEGGILADNQIDSGTVGVTSSFSTLSNALSAHAGNSIQNKAYGNMPTSGVGSVYIAPAEAMILGLEATTTVNIYLDVNSSANWLGGGGFSPDDAFAAIAHEITETAMGRISNPGSTPDVMDMFRFSGGQHDLTTGATSSSTLNSSAYFSIDGGATNLGTWPNDPGNGDFGDWSNGPVSNDAFGTQHTGVAPISEVDIELMNVLGWGVAAVTSGVTSDVTSGETFNGYTVMSGGVMVISSGGSARNTVYSNAQQFNDGVIAAGSSGGGGGIGFVEEDSSEVFATVDGGGIEWVEYGGYASGTAVSAWGSIVDFGEVESATISAHGSMGVSDSGYAYYTSVLAGGVTEIYSSGLSEHTSVFLGGVLSINAGGAGNGDMILNGGQDYVYGRTAFDVISAGGAETIGGGGSAVLDTVDAGGAQIILSGGVSDATVVYGAQYVQGLASGDHVSGTHGSQIVESGGSASNTTLSGGGEQYVFSGGYAANTTLGSGGIQEVYSGANVSATIVESGGYLSMGAGASVSALTVSSGGSVQGGSLIQHNAVAGSASDLTVGDANFVDSLDLLSGGVATNVTVAFEDDYLQVESGASATGAVLISGSYDNVFGATLDTTVGDQSTENVSSGGHATSTTILSGGTDFLESGGTADAVTVSAGGILEGPGTLIHYNTAAGTVEGVTVGDPYYGDTLEMLSGGEAENVTVTMDGDVLQIDSGASATGTIVSAGAEEYVLSGGVTSADVVFSDSGEILSAGAVGSGLTVSSGGLVVGDGVLSGANAIYGTAYVVSVGSAGLAIIYAGGVADTTTVLSGGRLVLSSGGVATGDIVSSGGKEIISSGGIASGTTVSSDGLGYVYAGGVASGALVQAGGREFISAGASAVSEAVSSGGVEYVMLSGTTTGTEVLGGGREYVSSGGVASGTTVLSGGAGEIYTGGRASGTKILGREYISSGGSGARIKVYDGGADYVMARGETTGTEVISGGKELISAGGSANGTFVESGGLEYVYADATASGTRILTGGRAYVSSGGSALAMTVSSGGTAYVMTAGVAGNVVVSSGGTLLISARAVVNGLVLNSGGKVFDAGTINIAGARTLSGALSGAGSIAETGASDLVLGGADAGFSGPAVISGGTIELAAAGAVGTGSVVFASPTAAATLQIDAGDAPAAGGTFATTISNFSGANDDIDLRSVAFVAGASARVSGSTLVLTDGGATYKFKLAGSIVGSFPVVSDGHGGTLIDPRVVAFTQAGASFAPSAAANAPLSSSRTSSSLSLLVHAAGSAGAVHI